MLHFLYREHIFGTLRKSYVILQIIVRKNQWIVINQMSIMNSNIFVKKYLHGYDKIDIFLCFSFIAGFYIIVPFIPHRS